MAARCLSFKEAAAELNITPSALSRRIKRLENFLGVELFERLNRGLKLTKKGQAYLNAIEDPVAAIARATERFLSRERGRTLTLGIPQFLNANWLVPRLPALQTAHPWLKLELSTVIGRPALGEGGMDAAIHYGLASDWDDMECVKLLDLSVFPVCNPQLVVRPPGLRTTGDLRAHTLLHAERLADLWPQWLAAVGHDDLAPAGTQTFDNARLCFDAAESGLGVAMAIDVLADRVLREGRLVAPITQPVKIKQAYYLVFAPELKSDERVRTLKSWLVAEAATTQPSAPALTDNPA